MNKPTTHPMLEAWPDKSSPLEAILLHLLPGLIITIVFAILARMTLPLGWPPSLALLLTWPITGIPLLLGILLYKGYKANGAFSLKGILLYRQPLSFGQYAGLVIALLVWTAVFSTLFSFPAESLRQALFTWWPAWLNLSEFARDPTNYSRSIQWAIIALSAILNIAVPVTEELYFRSYLLPRLPSGQKWSPLLSTVLFSLYHFWLPWDFFGRIVALLPVVYLVQRKQNAYLSILVHCLLNSLGTIGLLVMVAGPGK